MDKRLNIFDTKETELVHWIGYLTLFVFFAVALVIVVIKKDLFGIGLMGMLVFIGGIIGGSFLSEKGDLSSGEVRRSIAISFIFIFFALLAFGGEITIDCKNKIVTKILDNYWVFIVTIIGFYFGGRSLEKAAEKKEKTP